MSGSLIKFSLTKLNALTHFLSYLQKQIEHKNIVKTILLCVVSIRRKYFLKFGKHGKNDVTLSASYVCTVTFINFLQLQT